MTRNVRKPVFVHSAAIFFSAIVLTSCGGGAATDAGSSAAQIAIVSGNNQSGTAGSVLALPLTVKVTDSRGAGVAGVRVKFTATGGGGTLAPSNPATNSSGIAESAWTLGPTTAPQKASASADGLAGSPLAFSATASAAPPSLRASNLP